MNGYRTALSLLLLITLLFTSSIPTLAVNGTLTINTQTIASAEGEMVEATVSVVNNPGIAAFDLKINFDNNVLIPVSITQNSAMSSGSFTSNLQSSDDLNVLTFVTAVWINTINYTDNGEFFKVTFMVKPLSAQTTELSLSYRPGDICDWLGNDVNLETSGTSVQLTKEPYSLSILNNTLDRDSMNISGDVTVGITNLLAERKTVLIMAAYDSERVVAWVHPLTDLLIPAGSSQESFTGIKIPVTSAQSYSVKIMLWDSLLFMRPIADILPIDLS